jgi:hypothetical protein
MASRNAGKRDPLQSRQVNVNQVSSVGVKQMSRLDRLKAASKGTESKPVVVETEFKVVPQAAEPSVQSSSKSDQSTVKPSHLGERCDPSPIAPLCGVVNGAGMDVAPPIEGRGESDCSLSPRKQGRLEGTALSQRWPLDPEKKAALMTKVMGMALETTVPRELAALTRAVLSADAINLAEEKHANPKAQVTVHVNLDANQRANEIKTLLGESVTRRLGVDEASG